MNKEHKKLERLILFSEVAQSQSFTVAARKLGISRGHLSAQIKKLELDMGVSLFIRSTRSVRLTVVGERMMLGMDKIRLAMLELERNVEQEGQVIEGLIKITAPALFTQRYLLEIISKFRQLHPAVNFSIDCSYTSHDLNRKDFDLAFRSTKTPPLNMIARALISYEHCVCAAPKYFRINGKPQTPIELTNHQCIAGQDITSWPFKDSEVITRGWLKINDNLMLKELALAGSGIIKVPNYFVDREIKDGKLEAILTAFTIERNQIQIIYPQIFQQPKRLTTFIEFTIDYFKHIE